MPLRTCFAVSLCTVLRISTAHATGTACALYGTVRSTTDLPNLYIELLCMLRRLKFCRRTKCVLAFTTGAKYLSSHKLFLKCNGLFLTLFVGLWEVQMQTAIVIGNFESIIHLLYK